MLHFVITVGKGSSIAVDTVHSYVYWAETSKHVNRAKLDGSGQDIVTGSKYVMGDTQVID